MSGIDDVVIEPASRGKMDIATAQGREQAKIKKRWQKPAATSSSTTATAAPQSARNANAAEEAVKRLKEEPARAAAVTAASSTAAAQANANSAEIPPRNKKHTRYIINLMPTEGKNGTFNSKISGVQKATEGGRRKRTHRNHTRTHRNRNRTHRKHKRSHRSRR